MGASPPTMFPTGHTGSKGVHYFCFELVWVDELAGAFPEVPIVLTRMGRSSRASFDACREDDRLIVLEHTSKGRNVWRREQPAITVRPRRWLASGATDVRLPERFPSPAWRWLGAMRTMSCSGVQGARR